MTGKRGALLAIAVPGAAAAVRVYRPAVGHRSYRVVWRDGEGRQRERTSLTLAGAEAAATDVADDLASRVLGAGASASRTFGDLVDHYLFGPGRNPRRVAARSQRRLEQTARRLLSLDDLSVPLHALDGPTGSAWMRGLLGRAQALGMEPGGHEYEKAGLWLKSVVDAGVRDGLIVLSHGNPMQDVPFRRDSFRATPPGHLAAVDYVGPELRPSTAAVRALLDEAASAFGADLALFFAVMAFGGLRPGEAIGLTASQVGKDPAAPRLLVDRQVVELTPAEVGEGRYGTAALLVSRPKHNLTRSPFLTPDVHQQVVSLAARRTAESGDDHALLFPAPAGGHWRQGNLRRRRFGPAADAAGWPRSSVLRRGRVENPLVWPLYSLRHHYANYMLKDLGRPLVAVSHWMGHRDPLVTSSMYVKQEIADIHAAAMHWAAVQNAELS